MVSKRERGPTYRDAELVGVVDAHEGADRDGAIRRGGGDDLDVDDLVGSKRKREGGRVRKREGKEKWEGAEGEKGAICI